MFEFPTVIMTDTVSTDVINLISDLHSNMLTIQYWGKRHLLEQKDCFKFQA